MSSIGKLVGKVVGGITGSSAAAKGGERAAATQAAAAQAGIDEQRRQFDILTQLMQPYVEAGQPALEAQQGLIGLQGPEAQQAAISALEQSPAYTSLVQQGEEALLQNASATGGLRGGNVQGALAQFRPQLLSQLIESQYNKLGGITQLGQSAAAGQASAGLQTGSNIGNLLQQQGAATAGGQLARAGAQRQAFSDLLAVGQTAAGFF